ncbi:MAG: hypothetical protein E7Z82_01965 [Methanobrevibacter sp.]|nr:hypothetical protein [Methanobrevibacter sp.]
MIIEEIIKIFKIDKFNIFYIKQNLFTKQLIFKIVF